MVGVRGRYGSCAASPAVSVDRLSWSRCEPPAPASRRQLGVYKLLLLLGMLETPADVDA
jgi:hypothetical protein